MEEADLAAVAAIYAHYVETAYATFDLEAPDEATWRARLDSTRRAGRPWLVADLGGEIAGYATMSSFRSKPAYDSTVESTVYLRSDATGRGLGRPLYATALQRAAAGGFHLAVAGIALPNPSSVALHERLGFAPVGVFSEVGHKHGAWRDVGWWQLRLDTLR